jgi:hypothetical protein
LVHYNEVKQFDAILIPGGGITPEGQPNPWVCERLDRAAEYYQELGGVVLMPLSAGTIYKPPVRNDEDYPIFESHAAALYLIDKYNIPPEDILPEASSYSTIGNAAYARWILTDPNPTFDKLLVITSEFHMPRTKQLFEWVYSLEPNTGRYELSFETVKNVGLSDEMLAARADRDQASWEYIRPDVERIKTLQELQTYLLTKHPAEATRKLVNERPKVTAEGAKSY